MKLLSVNVGRPREVVHQGRLVPTGIFKQPVAGRVLLRRTNLEGDAQADLAVHGGPDKAVYAYPYEHYAHWREELGRDDFVMGQFGENLTLEGMLEHAVSIGDVYRVGDATVEVSQPRVPCFKLGVRLGDASFVKRFHHSRRTGFYLRVIEEGEIAAGDAIDLVDRPAGSLTVSEVFSLRHFEQGDSEKLKQAAGLPALCLSWREDFLRILDLRG